MEFETEFIKNQLQTHTDKNSVCVHPCGSVAKEKLVKSGKPKIKH